MIFCTLLVKGVISRERITYKQGISSKEFFGYFFAIGFPAAILTHCLVIVTRFGQFGQNLMTPMYQEESCPVEERKLNYLCYEAEVMSPDTWEKQQYNMITVICNILRSVA